MKFKIFLITLFVIPLFILLTLFIASINTFIDMYKGIDSFHYLETINEIAERQKTEPKIITNPIKTGIEYKVFFNNDKMGIRIDGYDIGKQVKLCDYKETVCKELTVTARANQKGHASIPRVIFAEFGNIHQGSVVLYIYE